MNSLPIIEDQTEVEGTISLAESYMDLTGTEARSAARHDLLQRLHDSNYWFSGIHPDYREEVFREYLEELSLARENWPPPDADALLEGIGDLPPVESADLPRETLADQVVELPEVDCQAFEQGCQILLVRQGYITAKEREDIARLVVTDYLAQEDDQPAEPEDLDPTPAVIGCVRAIDYAEDGQVQVTVEPGVFQRSIVLTHERDGDTLGRVSFTVPQLTTILGLLTKAGIVAVSQTQDDAVKALSVAQWVTRVMREDDSNVVELPGTEGN